MTIEQAIDDLMDTSRSIAEVAESESDEANRINAQNFADDCEQFAAWLKELQERRKAPEIIFCKDCEKHNKRFDEYPADEACPLTVWRVAQGHEFDYQFCVYGKRAEGRTDESNNLYV